MEISREGGDLFLDTPSWHDEKRIDKISYMQPGLLDHFSKRCSASQAAKPDLRKQGHYEASLSFRKSSIMA